VWLFFVKTPLFLLWEAILKNKQGVSIKSLFNRAALMGACALMASGCTTYHWDGNPGHQEPRIVEPVLQNEPIAAQVSELDTPPDLAWTNPIFKIFEVFTPEILTIEDAPKNITRNPLTRIFDIFNGRDSYKVKRVRYSGSDGQKANAYLYTPDKKGPHPAIIVFPILAETDSTVISELLAKELVRRDYVVLRMERRSLKFSETNTFGIPMDSFQDTILDARSLKDWLKDQPKVDSDKIGAAGFSLGSIMSATFMGIDPDIKAGVFMLGGGNLHNVLSDSNLDSIVAFREFMTNKLKLENEEQLSGLLKPHTYVFDPNRYAGSLHPCATMLVSGRFDDVVRHEHTQSLHERLGRPKWIIVPSGHKYTFTPFFFWAIKKADQHFRSVFEKGRCERANEKESLPAGNKKAGAIISPAHDP
jgi:pimeloyl-ACP methyl ester carboxylesterase